MPKKEIEELLEQPVPEQTLRTDPPIIRARVVYLGAKRNESVALPGSVMVEHFEEANGPVTRRVLKTPNADPKEADNWEERKFVQTRKAVTGGISSYDFSTHDVRGGLIKERLMPDTAPERLRGKCFNWVEHPGHLVEFHMGPKDREGVRRKGEFEVLARPEDIPTIQEYVRRAQRGERRQLADLEEVVRG